MRSWCECPRGSGVSGGEAQLRQEVAGADRRRVGGGWEAGGRQLPPWPVSLPVWPGKQMRPLPRCHFQQALRRLSENRPCYRREFLRRMCPEAAARASWGVFCTHTGHSITTQPWEQGRQQTQVGTPEISLAGRWEEAARLSSSETPARSQHSAAPSSRAPECSIGTIWGRTHFPPSRLLSRGTEPEGQSRGLAWTRHSNCPLGGGSPVLGGGAHAPPPGGSAAHPVSGTLLSGEREPWMACRAEADAGASGGG